MFFKELYFEFFQKQKKKIDQENYYGIFCYFLVGVVFVYIGYVYFFLFQWYYSLEVLDLFLNKEIEDEYVELLCNFGMFKLYMLDFSSMSIIVDGVR